MIESFIQISQICPFTYQLFPSSHSSTVARKSHGWRSLEGCSPWGCTESDTTEATQQQQQYVRQELLIFQKHCQLDIFLEQSNTVYACGIFCTCGTVLVCSSCYNKTSQTGQFLNIRNVFLTVLETGSLRAPYEHSQMRTLFPVHSQQLFAPSMWKWLRIPVRSLYINY